MTSTIFCGSLHTRVSVSVIVSAPLGLPGAKRREQPMLQNLLVASQLIINRSNSPNNLPLLESAMFMAYSASATRISGWGCIVV